MKLSLIIPCYNEAANLPLLLQRCASLGNNDEVEVILVDNGSTDDSPKVLGRLLPKYPNFHSIRVPMNQGYGFGILASTHADMQTDPKDVMKGLEIFERFGATDNKVSRDIYVKGRRIRRPLTDIIFTIGMSIFETGLLRKPFWDINAQPNIFSRKFFESWQNPPHDFSLDLYAYFMARNQGLSIYRFPVEFGRRIHGVSNWNINWNSKIKFIRRTVDFSFELKKRFFK